MERLSETDVSPSTNEVTYITSHINLTANTRTYFLIISSNDGNITVNKTLDYDGPHDLAWTPDPDIISFITDSDDNTSSVIIYNRATDSFYTAHTFPLAIDSVRWASVGPYFVFSTQVYPSKTMEETLQIDQEKYNADAQAMVFDQTYIYHWDTFETGKYRHVMYLKIIEDSEQPYKYLFNETVHDIMSSFDGNCPQKPSGGIEEFSIDSQSTYITFSTQVGNNQSWYHQKHIYLAQIVDSNETQPEPERLTEGNGSYSNPIFADLDDSGSWSHIFFLASHDASYFADQDWIRCYMRDTECITELPLSTEYSFDSLYFNPADPASLFAQSNRNGRRLLVVIDLEASVERRDCTGSLLVYPAEHGSCESVHFVANSADVITTVCSYVRPQEVAMWSYSEYLANGTAPTETDISNLSASVLNSCYPLHHPISLNYTGGSGDTINAFYWEPVEVANPPTESTDSTSSSGTAHMSADSFGKHPLIMYIHGGPEESWMEEWSYRWNPQLLVHQGYAVFAPQFHGGDSYGQWFMNDPQWSWGQPFVDVIDGLAYILANHTTATLSLDHTRLGAVGASYAGYMVNMLQTHTNVFNVLVCHDGIFDMASEYTESDELWTLEYPFRGLPWTSSLYDNLSASFACQDPNYTQTPQLTFHGYQDYCCPFSQGVQIFHTLQGKGIPSRFVVFPDENHWVLNYQNSRRWHQEVFAWLRNYI